MEVEYKREMNRNYMVLRPEPGHVDRYTIRMLSGNQVGGLLPFHEKWLDGENRYYYDITSKQPLGRILEYRRMNGDELYSFWTGFLNAMGQIERFLLDENQLCLKPEYIYVEPESFQCSLLMIPGAYSEYTSGFQMLCQYLLDHVNQNDGDAVILGFSVFKESQKPNFGMDDIERCMGLIKNKKFISEEKWDEQPEKKVQECVQENLQECVQENLQECVQENLQECVQESSYDSRKIRRQRITFLGICIAIFLIPALLLLIGGMGFLMRYKLYIFGVEILLICGAALLINMKGKSKLSDLEKEADNQSIIVEEFSMWGDKCWENELEECPKTILLTAKPVGGTTRFLVPVGGGEEIPIRYFPFLIGKNPGIVDFCLNETGISRMHAKLEESNGVYYVTDLNSTNGIMVGGVWLETNEKRELPIGSELVLAASRFYFR